MLHRAFVFTLILFFGNYRVIAATPVMITIDPARHYQRISGFGVSGCWWAQLTDAWPPTLLNQALDLLFTKRGAALNIYRYNIGAGGGPEIPWPSRRAATVEISPGIYDLSRDRAAINILDAIRLRGITNVIVTSNSPPIRLTRNGLASGGDGGGYNLRKGSEHAYAKYLVDIANLIRQREKLQRVGLTPINEPQWRWGSDKRTQEGCYYSPQQAALVVQDILEEITNRHLPIDVQAPDLGRWGKESAGYVQALLSHPFIYAHLQALSIHSYFSDADEKPVLADLIHKLNPHLEVNMTEFCQMEPGRHLDMDAALDVAQVIYDDLTLGNVSTWEWWLAVSSSNFADGLLYITPNHQKLLISKRFDVLAEFSRFILPASIRIAATCNNPNLKVLAFLSPDQSRITAVLINFSQAAVPATLLLPKKFHLSQKFITDANHRIVQGAMDTSLHFPARSVTTLVYEIDRHAI